MNPIRILLVLSSFIVVSKQNVIPSMDDWKPIGIYDIMKHCVQQPEVFTCLKKQLFIQINDAIHNNESWPVNRFVLLKKDPNWVEDVNSTSVSESRTFSSGSIMEKLKDLVGSRMLQISLGGSETLVEEGRKKSGGKDKHGMMMLGGMAFMAMMAQMVLGKIAFMAAAAFLLAKLALLFSALGGLKKSGGGGGGSEVVVDHGHSGGYSASGWQRSIDQREQHHDPYKGHAYASTERL